MDVARHDPMLASNWIPFWWESCMQKGCFGATLDLFHGVFDLAVGLRLIRRRRVH